MANHEPELQQELLQYLRALIPPQDVLCETVNRGDRGLLVAMPSGRIVALCVTIPSRAFVERVQPSE